MRLYTEPSKRTKIKNRQRGSTQTTEYMRLLAPFFSLDKLNNLQEVGDGDGQGPRKGEKDV